MGEANKRGSFEERVKAAGIGLETLEHCYAMLLDVARGVYRESDGLNHDLKGITIRDGKCVGVSSLVITDVGRIPELVAQMLKSWPLVVHTMEAWGTEKPNMVARDDPDRTDIISFMFHTPQVVMCAICPVDTKARTIQKGPLAVLTHLVNSIPPDSSVVRH